MCPATSPPPRRNWGADVPLDSHEARDRVLDAAEECYADKGVDATTIADVARRAGVHRSTIYYYFPNREALLAASFVRAIEAVLEAADACWQRDEPFLDNLVAASIRGNQFARNSPAMRLLIGNPGAAGETYRAAEHSQLWHRRLTTALEGRLADAADAGEVRGDLAPATLARWIVRVNFSLMAEPADDEDGGEAGILHNLLAASLAPRPE